MSAAAEQIIELREGCGGWRATLTTTDMTKREARACVNKINSGIESVRGLILDLHERKGWSALGYSSWRECVSTEFPHSERHLYRELTAAKVDRVLTNWSKEPVHVPEGHARELAKLREPDAIAEAWKEAASSAPEGAVTAKHVAAAVAKRIAAEQPRTEPGAVEMPDGTVATPDPEAWWTCPIDGCGKEFNRHSAAVAGWISRGFCDDCEGEAPPEAPAAPPAETTFARGEAATCVAEPDTAELVSSVCSAIDWALASWPAGVDLQPLFAALENRLVDVIERKSRAA